MYVSDLLKASEEHFLSLSIEGNTLVLFNVFLHFMQTKLQIALSS